MWQALSWLLGILKQVTCSLCPQGVHIINILMLYRQQIWECIVNPGNMARKISLNLWEFFFMVWSVVSLNLSKILVFVINFREVLGGIQGIPLWLRRAAHSSHSSIAWLSENGETIVFPNTCGRSNNNCLI